MKWVAGKIRLFKWGGINVCFHWSYLLFPAGTLLCFGWMRGRMDGVYFMLGLLFILAISCLFHEYCHCLAARICTGQKGFTIILIPFGAVALIKSLWGASPLKEFVIALAGPVGSVVFGGIAWLTVLAVKGLHLDYGLIGYHARNFLSLLSAFNFVMAVFNVILFVFPADGGRLCRAILHGILLRYSRLDDGSAHLLATKLVVRSGWIVSPVIIFAMIYAGFIIFPLFILLPLLCIAGEAELLVLRENYDLLEFGTSNEEFPDNTICRNY